MDKLILWTLCFSLKIMISKMKKTIFRSFFTFLVFVFLCGSFATWLSIKTIYGLPIIDIKKVLSNEQKWIVFSSNRTIFKSKIDGSEKTVLFDNIGPIGCRIHEFDSSYNGKRIIAVLANNNVYSLWVIDLDTSNQQCLLPENKGYIECSQISNKGDFIVCEFNNQAWFAKTDDKILRKLGETLTESTTHYPSISPDDSKILFIRKKAFGNEVNNSLWIREMDTNLEYEITNRSDGSFGKPVFCFDSKTIITPRKSVNTKNFSLWFFDCIKKEFDLIAEIKDSNILAVKASRSKHSIAFTTGKDFYFYNYAKLIKLFSTEKNRIGSFNIKLSHDAQYLIFWSSDFPDYLAKTDGSFVIDLNSLQNENLVSPLWYNHPPFPSVVTAQLKSSGNYLTWVPSRQGTYPIKGYNVYRSTFPKKNYSLIFSTASTTFQFMDTKCDLNQNYYYMVRSFDDDGTESMPSNEALMDKTLPDIKFTNPASGTYYRSKQVFIEGFAVDLESGIDKVLIDHTPIAIADDGAFAVDYVMETEGENIITGLAYDKFGNSSKASLSLFLDSIPPQLDIVFPQDNTELFAIDTNARGKVTDLGSGLHTFTLNNQEVLVNSDGSFLIPIPVAPGSNTYQFEATDKVGNKTQKIIQVKGVVRIIVQLTIGSNSIVVNDKESTIDAPPFIHVESKRTIVPARFVVEPIGGNITFDATEQKVTILREENKIELWIGKNIALVNGKEVPIDPIPSLTPMIVSGRTFLPLRFISENIGFKVGWDPKKYEIRLEFPDPDKFIRSTNKWHHLILIKNYCTRF
jgi:hypothetical protein